MAECPSCGGRDAYIGFSSIECPNEKCEHYKIEMKKKCACCGNEGHEVGSCPSGLGADYDDSAGNGPPPIHSAAPPSSGPPPDYSCMD